MTLEDRVHEIIEKQIQLGANLGCMIPVQAAFIKAHIEMAIKEDREAIAKMVETWGNHGQGGYCLDVYPEIAKAIREGKTCIHEWIDIRNSVIQSGEMCKHCGNLRAGNEATGSKRASAWKFRASDPKRGLNPG